MAYLLAEPVFDAALRSALSEAGITPDTDPAAVQVALCVKGAPVLALIPDIVLLRRSRERGRPPHEYQFSRPDEPE